MDGVDGYLLHVGMTALFVYTRSKLSFRFPDEFKQIPLRTDVFLILITQKFQQQRKNCFLDQCVQVYTSALGLF